MLLVTVWKLEHQMSFRLSFGKIIQFVSYAHNSAPTRHEIIEFRSQKS